MAAILRVRPRPPRRDQLFFGLFVGTAGATSTSPLTFSGALANNHTKFADKFLLYNTAKPWAASQVHTRTDHVVLARGLSLRACNHSTRLEFT